MTDFQKNAPAYAKTIMEGITPEFAQKFSLTVKLLAEYPSLISSKKRQVPGFWNEAQVKKWAISFNKGRLAKSPKPPSTMPDELVGYVLMYYFSVPDDQIKRVAKEHSLAMAAENMVGNLLERYLASVLEPSGWIWCSGPFVKYVDFVFPPSRKGEAWRLLQVKNRDNSENSASSSVRDGTPIEKWFRSFSKTGKTNWESFPDKKTAGQLSEAAFKKFVKSTLYRLKDSSQ